MNHNILENEGRREVKEETGTGSKQKTVEEEDVDCVDTKVQIWDGEQYEQFESDYLNQIFPYKINKKTMAADTKFIFHFLSSSLHYWVELVQQEEPQNQRLGKKDIKVIDQMLKTGECDNWIAYHRWSQQFNKKQQFHKYEQAEGSYIEPKGKLIHSYTRGSDEFLIVEYLGGNKQFTPFKQRMQVLFLFYIDGVSFVFEQIDNWIYYVVFKKKQKSQRKIFVGVLSKYVFKLSTVKERHRISQVFILPSYQKSGHGKELIDAVYDISLKDQKCFEITTQIPSFQYQCLRDYKEIEMIVSSKIIDISIMKPVVNKTEIDLNRSLMLTKENVRKIKENLKIPGHQIERLINLLIYYKIQTQNDDMPKAYFEEDLRQKIILNRSPFKTRRKLPHITLYGQVPILKDFLLQKAKEDLLRNQDEVQEILTETINGYNRVIAKLRKVKLLE